MWRWLFAAHFSTCEPWNPAQCWHMVDHVWVIWCHEKPRPGMRHRIFMLLCWMSSWKVRKRSICSPSCTFMYASRSNLPCLCSCLLRVFEIFGKSVWLMFGFIYLSACKSSVGSSVCYCCFACNPSPSKLCWDSWHLHREIPSTESLRIVRTSLFGFWFHRPHRSGWSREYVHTVREPKGCSRRLGSKKAERQSP